jgi:hypothetical protein
MGGGSEPYSPTPNELCVVPGIDTYPTSDQVLGRGKLDTPSQDMDGGDEINKAVNPTMSGDNLSKENWAVY